MLVYLDNAATTFPKPRSVIESAYECVTEYCANPGRSVHRLAIKVSEKIYETRERIATYLGLSSPERVVFTSNATQALNIAIQGSIDHKCHVIISDIEHNSVLRPINLLRGKYGVKYSTFNSDTDILTSIGFVIRPDTEYLITTLQSNVTGKIIDPIEIYRAAKKYKLKVIIDASQYLGHMQLDLASTPFDMICAPGHKGLMGLQGSGILVVPGDLLPKPLIYGGSGSNSIDRAMPEYMPDRYEAGTLNAPSIISLGAGVEYLTQLGDDYIRERLTGLTNRLREILLSVGVRLYGCEGGIACFGFEGMSSSYLAALLDEHGIATRSGLHCAPSIHEKLGTLQNGLVRASLSIHNTDVDLDYLYKSLLHIKKEYLK